jgi:predicted dehydrogenase
MAIGIAVVGAGMAGRAHAAAYRIAPTLYESTLPPLRFVSIGDVSLSSVRLRLVGSASSGPTLCGRGSG